MNDFLNQDLFNDALPLAMPDYVPIVKVPVITKEIQIPLKDFKTRQHEELSQYRDPRAVPKDKIDVKNLSF